MRPLRSIFRPRSYALASSARPSPDRLPMKQRKSQKSLKAILKEPSRGSEGGAEHTIAASRRRAYGVRPCVGQSVRWRPPIRSPMSPAALPRSQHLVGACLAVLAGGPFQNPKNGGHGDATHSMKAIALLEHCEIFGILSGCSLAELCRKSTALRRDRRRGTPLFLVGRSASLAGDWGTLGAVVSAATSSERSARRSLPSSVDGELLQVDALDVACAPVFAGGARERSVVSSCPGSMRTCFHLPLDVDEPGKQRSWTFFGSIPQKTVPPRLATATGVFDPERSCPGVLRSQPMRPRRTERLSGPPCSCRRARNASCSFTSSVAPAANELYRAGFFPVSPFLWRVTPAPASPGSISVASGERSRVPSRFQLGVGRQAGGPRLRSTECEHCAFHVSSSARRCPRKTHILYHGPFHSPHTRPC